MISRAKVAFTYSLEIIVAALMALVFFVALFFLMNKFFPIGPGLDVLIIGGNKQGVSALDITRSLWVSSGGKNAGLSSGSGTHVASLARIKNDVRSKKANAIAWRTAFKNQQLFDQDSIQTFSRSTALIHFDEHNEVELGPNSLIIIKKLESDLLWPEKRTFMVMVDGELRGKIKAQGNNPLYLEIETPNAVANVQSLGGSSGIDFKISVDSASSSSITVYEGLATITGAGKSIEINANETTKVSGKNAPAIPERLPESIRLIAPKENKQIIYRDLPPKVKFEWAPDEFAKEYRFELARDAEFRDILYEDVVKATRFIHGNMKKGHYFWRVVGINKNGGEGQASEVNRVQLAQDRDPPKLTLKLPEPELGQKKYIVTGQAEPGASVFVRGEKMQLDAAGVFTYEVELQQGVNIVVIEAVDNAGNITYQSETIHGKF